MKYLNSLHEIQIRCTYCHLTDIFITGLHYEKFSMVQKTPSMLQAKAWWCILKCNFNMVETQKFPSKQQPCRVQITIMWKLNSWQQHVEGVLRILVLTWEDTTNLESVDIGEVWCAKKPFNSFRGQDEWAGGGGQKMSVFVHAQGIKMGCQTMAKFCPRCCWMPPNLLLAADLESNLGSFSLEKNI